MVEYTEKFILNINKDFEYIDLIPSPCGIIDIDNNYLLKSNNLLCELLKIEKNIPINLENFSLFEFSTLLNNFSFDNDNIIKTNTELIQINDSKGERINAEIDMRIIKNNNKNLAIAIFKWQTTKENKDTIKEINNSVSEIYEVIDGIFQNLPVFACIPDRFDSNKFSYINKFTEEVFRRNKNIKSKITDLLIKKSNGEITSIAGEEIDVDGNIFVLSFITFNLMGNRRLNFLLGLSDFKFRKSSIRLKAGIDSITGAFNKHYAINNIDNLIFKAEIEGSIFSLCYIDVNDLKTINKEMGNSKGDELLKKIVEIAKKYIRKSDYVARIDSDEFIIILPDCNAFTSKRIMKAISDAVFDKINEDYNLNSEIISYGILEVNRLCKCSAEELIKNTKDTIIRL